MKKHISTYASLVMASMALASCSDDFLDVTNPKIGRAHV